MLDVTQALDRRSSETLASAAAVASGCSTRDFGNGKTALLFVLLMGVVSIPILLNPLPPISDYINHLARMHIIATISSDPYLHRYYEIDWQVIPNLTMDLIVPWLVRVMNVFLAGQIYTLTSFALIISGALALHRQLFGRWSPLPLIAVPLLYNDVFLVGMMNYVFGIGLMLWALAAWVALRERGRTLRLLASSPFVLALFFCHLFALGVYGVGLLAFESQRLLTAFVQVRHSSGRDSAARALLPLIVDFVMTGLLFLPVPVLLMLSPTWGLSGSYSWGSLDGKIDGLMNGIEAYSHAAALVSAVVIAFLAGWTRSGRVLSFHSFGLALLAIGAVIYMALPPVMFADYWVDQRLPIALAFILVACIDVDFRSRTVRRGFAVAVILLVTMRVAEVESTWRTLAAEIESFRESVQLLDRGAKVFVAYADPDGGDTVSDYGLVHADCIAVIDRSALVTTEFTVMGKQILHARPAYRSRVDTEDSTPPMIADLVQVAARPDMNIGDYWRRWTSDYDYLYVLFTDPGFANPDPAHLTQIFAGERFVLYRIERSAPTEVNEVSK